MLNLLQPKCLVAFLGDLMYSVFSLGAEEAQFGIPNCLGRNSKRDLFSAMFCNHWPKTLQGSLALMTAKLGPKSKIVAVDVHTQWRIGGAFAHISII